MTDSLGYRAKFGVLVPSTNTSVQPEFDAMRPLGVTNHTSRIRIPNMALENDDDFARLVDHIAAGQIEAVDSVMTAEPDRIVLGISVETFWGGYAISRKLKAELEAHTGLPVSMGAEASELALKRLGARRIGVVTPYWPVGDKNVAQFFTEAGFEVVKIVGIEVPQPRADRACERGRARSGRDIGRWAGHRRRHPGRHEPRHGAARARGRAAARQAGRRHQHGDLLACAARVRDRRQDRRVRTAARGLLT